MGIGLFQEINQQITAVTHGCFGLNMSPSYYIMRNILLWSVKPEWLWCKDEKDAAQVRFPVGVKNNKYMVLVIEGEN